MVLEDISEIREKGISASGVEYLDTQARSANRDACARSEKVEHKVMISESLDIPVKHAGKPDDTIHSSKG